MDLIDDFLSRYRREYDFYELSARLVAQQLDARLQASGIRAMVTSRAKNARRLETKVRQRGKDRSYDSVQAIYDDIVDLAGVRVALYFPAERHEVEKIVNEQFNVAGSPKSFVGTKPKSLTGTETPSYTKRFSGYWATHYRVQLREGSLDETLLRYVDARVEVQVASVLMHAWAEVEHDLVYKPLQEHLSEDELAILDELNGMVLAGEIALERLQRAAERRSSQQGSRFNNHFDLASFLLRATGSLREAGGAEPVLGDVELLFRLLTRLDISTPDALREYLAGLHPDTERRAVAEQIIDQVLATDIRRYKVYAELRSFDGGIGTSTTLTSSYVSNWAQPETDMLVLAEFLRAWITFETFLHLLAETREDPGPPLPSSALIQSLQVFDTDELAEVNRIRRLRNHAVHGRAVDTTTIRDATTTVWLIMQKLSNHPRAEVREAAKRAMNSD